MSDRTRTTLRFLAGSYLAYTGFNLVKNILAERPDNFIVFMIVGAFFLAAGLALALHSLKHYIQCDYIHRNDEDGQTEEEEIADDKDQM